MMRRFLLFLILPLALGCQKNATAQATHSGYQALTECFRQWPSETGITGMTIADYGFIKLLAQKQSRNS